MKIEISLDTKDAADLAALMALVGSLGGASAPLTAGQLAAESVRQANKTLRRTDTLGTDIDDRPILADVGTMGQDIDPPAPDQYASLPNPEGAPDVDSRGLPWDERIHAGTKATNADGSWRNKRGVDKALVETVEAELAGSDAVPNAPTDEPVATASGAADAGGASEIPLPPAPVAEAAGGIIPDAPAAPTPADAPTFKDAMAIVTTRQREGTLTQVQVSEAAQALGLSSVVDLAKPANAEHIAAFIALLG
jgi:hypothetical protein